MLPTIAPKQGRQTRNLLTMRSWAVRNLRTAAFTGATPLKRFIKHNVAGPLLIGSGYLDNDPRCCGILLHGNENTPIRVPRQVIRIHERLRGVFCVPCK